jgi:hypothetical protein
MKANIGHYLGAVALVAAVSACGTADMDARGNGEASQAVRDSGKNAKLNLSHIECTEDGDVLAHFVLLFAGSGQPGALTGTYNGGDFGPTEAEKNSGNVWHYNVILPSGEIDIYSATTTTSSGASASLHNPSEYAGDYQCGEIIEDCPVEVEAADLFCTDQPLGNPGEECGAFGLVPQGKDDNLSGLTFVATQDAYVALVKSGSRGCERGGSAYRVIVDVSEGDTLSTPVDQDISHVTYCACPAE